MREKGKKPNVEEGGPSKSSPKLKKIVLYCSYPHLSSDYIDFGVTPGYCDNRRNYRLDSDHVNHIVHRHNPEKKFVLTHKEYEHTLKQWLEDKENRNNWCPTYQDWGVYRPKDVARQIIQGILRAVYELHTNNSFHGFLYHPENFAIRYDESIIGGDCKNIKYIFLTHDNVEPGSSFGAPDKNKVQQEKRKDISALRNVIFQKILVGPLLSYPEKKEDLPDYLLKLPKDLQNLHALLKKCKVNSQGWKLIVNHPSLWHWKSRFSYIERVWMQYKHADQNTKKAMDGELTDINVRNWPCRIPKNTPLERIYKNNKYDAGAANELLRYLRIVRFHYVDGEYVNRQTETEYLDQQYIEHITTEVSELFLVELYKKMCNLEMDI